MRDILASWRNVGCAAIFALGASPAASQSEEDFYKGKVITLTVGISPGGGYDQYARLLARHFAKHIPGAPTIVVRNMPGAGSLNSVLNLSRVAPTDGTHIGTFNAGLLNDSVMEGKAASVKFDTFSWLGSMARDLRVCLAYKNSAINSWEDLVQGKPAVFGAPGANSNSANGIAMIRNLFNLQNLRTITAYPGLLETNLAMERGEVDGTCASWIAIPERWITEKEATVLLRLSPNTIPEIPSSVEYIRDLVQGPEEKSLVDALVSSGELARPFILSNKVPPARVAILRKAFASTLADSDFLADAGKLNLMIDPVDGSRAQDIVNRLYSMPSDVAEKARAILKN
jgi:hypothetical protein